MRGTKTDKKYVQRTSSGQRISQAAHLFLDWCKLQLDFSTLPLHHI
jgi:hypothetical protein